MANAVSHSEVLACSGCGYDLRAHRSGSLCPECGAPVEESIKLAAVPRRPDWRDSDPRWRRRMLAGVWCLATMLLLFVNESHAWPATVPVPRLFDYRSTVSTLDQTLFEQLYTPVLFCIGTVLLFSEERGRRSAKLDWTRRWGVICAYFVFIVGLSEVIFIVGLVTTGIAALCLSIRAAYQPHATDFLIWVGTHLLWYGPQPGRAAGIVVPEFAAVVMLLASVPLYDALRSSGPRSAAAILSALIALPAAWQIVYLAYDNLHAFLWPVNAFLGSSGRAFYFYSAYFSPDVMLTPPYFFGTSEGPGLYRVGIEYAKWGGIFAAAIWLGVAQFRSRRNGERLRANAVPLPADTRRSRLQARGSHTSARSAHNTTAAPRR